MRFAKTVFFVAGLWGLVVLTPLYFTFDVVGRLYPPRMTHPDFYYGFIGVAVAWQIGFLVIGRDPARLHPMMIPAVLEKLVYVISLSALYLQGRLAAGQFAVAGPGSCARNPLHRLLFQGRTCSSSIRIMTLKRHLAAHRISPPPPLILEYSTAPGD